MQNGNGQGSGKRWLLIGLLVLGGFWLLNDAYEDGYRDALVRSGQVTNVRVWRDADGPHFPWGLLILGGIGYVAWRKGAFDRFHGNFPGHGGDGQRGVQPYGGGHGPSGGPGSGQGFSATFRGPRAFFDEWHRQSHEAAQAQRPAPQAPAAPPAGQPGAAGNATPGQQMPQSPPPPPPAPDYWNSMSRPAEAPGTPGAPISPAAPPAGPEAQSGGPAPERW